MRLLALLLCTAALIVAGCGSKDEQSTAAPAKATATPSQDSGDRGSYGY